MVVVGYGVADLGVGHILDVGDQKADFPGRELVDFHWLWRQNAKRLHIEGTAIRHQTDPLTLAEHALNDTRQHDDAAIGIEPRIENKRLKWVRGAALRRRNVLYDGLQHIGNTLSRLGADG